MIRSRRDRFPYDSGVREEERSDDHSVVPERAHRSRRLRGVVGVGRKNERDGFEVEET